MPASVPAIACHAKPPRHGFVCRVSENLPGLVHPGSHLPTREPQPFIGLRLFHFYSRGKIDAGLVQTYCFFSLSITMQA